MTDFQHYLSQVASRLRHDLKGGLITLKMGLESLPDEEALKPLLVEKAEELSELSDKLILLLRMGELKRSPVRPSSLFQQAARQAEERFPPLRLELSLAESLEQRWNVDPDAVTYAILELAQNAKTAGATRLSVTVNGNGKIQVGNDGEELPDDYYKFTELGQSGWGRSGLGLSIVESCLQQHGGTFGFSSAVDGGAAVELQFQIGDEA